jgi:hypothetical protein
VLHFIDEEYDDERMANVVLAEFVSVYATAARKV